MSQPRGLVMSSLMRESNRYIIKHIVQEQVRVIDAKILTAHKAGFNYVEHELPINFNINNMDKSDSQTIIYSEIIEKYITPEAAGGKGFTDVKIDGSTAKATLYIKWLNGMDDDERVRRKRLISQHATIKR